MGRVKSLENCGISPRFGGKKTLLNFKTVEHQVGTRREAICQKWYVVTKNKNHVPMLD